MFSVLKTVMVASVRGSVARRRSDLPATRVYVGEFVRDLLCQLLEGHLVPTHLEPWLQFLLSAWRSVCGRCSVVPREDDDLKPYALHDDDDRGEINTMALMDGRRVGEGKWQLGRQKRGERAIAKG